MAHAGDLVFTVTTLKDNLTNVRRFVSGNLACGADHMVIVLDDPAGEGQAEVRAWLDAQPTVTCIAADDSWWHDARPKALNARQRLNANAVRTALRDVRAAAWLFHVDGDEVVQLDRAALAGVPRSAEVVWLPPLEAVAQRRAEAPPTLFKRLLGEEDLALLTALGVIDQPKNSSYFNGHVRGKSGIRPGIAAHITLHHVVDDENDEIAPYDDASLAGLGVLHYESVSGEEFVRKWSAMVTSGKPPALRPGREGLGAALRALLTKDLPADVRERHLMTLFERHRLDDVETLESLGLLRHADPTQGTHSPASLDAKAAKQWSDALAAVTARPKQDFRVSPPEQPTRSRRFGAKRR
ncbi:MAG: glycosyltransferase family 2 protein [Nocardioidaceae bacterium]|nr:glycosyltransferase family 2 protein [Nocardioidaceae bacterium]MCL2613056.1 glycosyltransferase family 2 protein [Nocardioidaceae bacterium]